jgi:hypothetical protein
MTQTDIHKPAPTHEQRLTNLVLAISALLAQEFEEIAVERSVHADSMQACPLGQSAEAAERIHILCRRLRTQAERFERFDRMCAEAEADRQAVAGTGEDDLPF